MALSGFRTVCLLCLFCACILPGRSWGDELSRASAAAMIKPSFEGKCIIKVIDLSDSDQPGILYIQYSNNQDYDTQHQDNPLGARFLNADEKWVELAKKGLIKYTVIAKRVPNDGGIPSHFLAWNPFYKRPNHYPGQSGCPHKWSCSYYDAFSFAWTSEALPYIDTYVKCQKGFSNNYFASADTCTCRAVARLGEIDTLEITGVTKPADMLGRIVCHVDFIARFKSTPFGEVYFGPAGLATRGSAAFTLYDDGWRLESIQNGWPSSFMSTGESRGKQLQSGYVYKPNDPNGAPCGQSPRDAVESQITEIGKLVAAKNYTEANQQLRDLDAGYPNISALTALGISAASVRYLSQYRTLVNQNMGQVRNIIERDTFTLNGIVTDKSEITGSGCFWGFEVKSDYGNKYGFMCNASDEVYFRLEETDIDTYEGYKQLKNVHDTIKLYIQNSQKDYVIGKCKNQECNGICPKAIVMFPSDSKDAQPASSLEKARLRNEARQHEQAKDYAAALKKLDQLLKLDRNDGEAQDEYLRLKRSLMIKKATAVAAGGGPATGRSTENQSSQIGSIRRSYHSSLWDKIRRQWSLPDYLRSQNLEAVVTIVVRRDGIIISQRYEKRSGNAEFDRAVEAAIQKAQPLPPFPEAYSPLQEEIGLRFRPKDS